MTNKNISGLTAATTPLAGTETIPVWDGATKKVAVDDLTVKSIRSNATSGILQIAGPAAASTRVATVPNANWTAARTDAAQSFTGDQTLATGNMVQGTAAKGFNFTANTPAAGMTSQLLNWYEEGTWTPAFTTNNGTDGTLAYTSSGRYTRIGRMVHYMGTVTLTDLGSRTNRVQINGLPFSAAGGLYPGIVIAQNVTITAVQMAGEVGNVSFTAVAFALTNSGGALGYLDIAQCTSSSSFWFSGSYSI
jgi:hypothetical protein